MDDVEARLARLESDMATALQLLRAIATALQAALHPGGGGSAGTQHLARGLEKVAYTVTGAEQTISGEIQGLDARLAALADDVRRLWAGQDSGTDGETDIETDAGIDGETQG